MRDEAFSCDAAGVEIRCLIVDDNERFLSAARASLGRDGINVVGTATSSAEALRLTAELQPNVVLVDISLGEESGFDLTRRLVERFPGLDSRVVLISTRAEEDFADLIATSPAVGFIPKSRLAPLAVRDLVGANGPTAAS
jgi:two-component system, NarL family, nitrate/nitrite response regulator NarL